MTRPESCFNSFTVQLKARHSWGLWCWETSFNSFTVQLKAEPAPEKSEKAVEFQFIYCAIKSHMESKNIQTPMEVSIHLLCN